MTKVLRLTLSLTILLMGSWAFGSVAEPSDSKNLLQIIAPPSPAEGNLFDFHIGAGDFIPPGAITPYVAVEPPTENLPSFRFTPLVVMTLPLGWSDDGLSLGELRGVLVFKPEGTTYWHSTDHEGSSNVITDSTGKVVWDGDYEAFGSVVRSNGTLDFTPSYTGKEFDKDTGLYYYNARWYDPTLGRFISTDPIRSGDNWEIYALANPLRYTDPTGLESVSSKDQTETFHNWQSNWNTIFLDSRKSYTNLMDAARKKAGDGFGDAKWRFDEGQTGIFGPEVEGAYRNYKLAQAIQAGTPETFERALTAATKGERLGFEDLNKMALREAAAQNGAGSAVQAALFAGAGMGGRQAPRSGNISLIDAEIAEANRMVSSASSGSKLPYSTSRPTYAKDQVQTVWENANQSDGKVYDPFTFEEIKWDPSLPRNGQWDMGHRSPYRDLHADYLSGKITKEQFLKEYRDPDNYFPQTLNSNRSGRNE